MRFFCFFYTNKRSGGVGAKPPQIIKHKKFIVLFPPHAYLKVLPSVAGGLRQEPKSAN